MPNKCTGCGRVYEDFAVELVKGCSCGSNVFLYKDVRSEAEREETRVEQSVPDTSGESSSGEVRREIPSASADIPEGAAPGPAAFDVDEQEVVETVEHAMEEIRESSGERQQAGPVRFDMEAIKVLEEGVYDINLSKLSQREPLIVEIKEDGKYFVHLASVFQERMEVEEEALDEELPARKRLRAALAETVPEAKETISEMVNPDIETMIELEKEGKDRKTLLEWLEKRLD